MDKVSTKKLNSEEWKYTNSDIFKNFDLKFNPTSEVLKQKCNLNEIIIYNGQVTQYGENIKNDKIQIHNIYHFLLLYLFYLQYLSITCYCLNHQCQMDYLLF